MQDSSNDVDHTLNALIQGAVRLPSVGEVSPPHLQCTSQLSTGQSYTATVGVRLGPPQETLPDSNATLGGTKTVQQADAAVAEHHNTMHEYAVSKRHTTTTNTTAPLLP